MRVKLVLVKTAIAWSVLVQAANAQGASAREALLVTPAWLAAHVKDPNIVILHVGAREKYAGQHIPGARFIDPFDVSVTDDSDQPPPPPDQPKPPLTGPRNGLAMEMPTPEQLRSQLVKYGISDDSRIVIYKADDYASPSTRVAFTLDYAGLGKNTVMLDGGLPAWIAAGNEVTSVVPPPAQPGKLSAITPRPIIVDAEFVRTHATTPGFAIIDARAPMFYQGLNTNGSSAAPASKGHIPGARSIPFNTLNDDSGKLKSAELLSAIFTQAGVRPGDTIVAYCHIGQQATAVLFAARTLGHPVLLYDGSMNDWNNRKNPLEK